jgi:hypothetical protein
VHIFIYLCISIFYLFIYYLSIDLSYLSIDLSNRFTVYFVIYSFYTLFVSLSFSYVFFSCARSLGRSVPNRSFSLSSQFKRSSLLIHISAPRLASGFRHTARASSFFSSCPTTHVEASPNSVRGSASPQTGTSFLRKGEWRS